MKSETSSPPLRASGFRTYHRIASAKFVDRFERTHEWRKLVMISNEDESIGEAERTQTRR